MSNPDRHRRRAMRYLQLADRIADPAMRAKAVDLAIKWAARAKEAEQRTPVTRSKVVEQQEQ